MIPTPRTWRFSTNTPIKRYTTWWPTWRQCNEVSCGNFAGSASNGFPVRLEPGCGAKPECRAGPFSVVASAGGWMANVQRRLLRPALQHSDQDQRSECEGAEPGVDVSAAEEQRCSRRAPGGHAAGGERIDVYHVAG